MNYLSNIPSQLLLWTDVQAVVEFSKNYVYVLLKKDQPSKPFKISDGGRLNTWLVGDIDAFIASRVSNAREVES